MKKAFSIVFGVLFFSSLMIFANIYAHDDDSLYDGKVNVDPIADSIAHNVSLELILRNPEKRLFLQDIIYKEIRYLSNEDIEILGKIDIYHLENDFLLAFKMVNSNPETEKAFVNYLTNNTEKVKQQIRKVLSKAITTYKNTQSIKETASKVANINGGDINNASFNFNYCK